MNAPEIDTCVKLLSIIMFLLEFCIFLQFGLVLNIEHENSIIEGEVIYCFFTKENLIEMVFIGTFHIERSAKKT